MRKRIAGSPVLATIILIVAGLIVGSVIFIWNTVGSSDTTQIYKIGFSSVYQVKPVSVENAGWQLVCIVNNLGSREAVVEKIFVNGELVVETGLIHGDSLSSTTSVGTSIPVDGLKIAPGDKATFYIWIGSKRFNSGTVINIDLQRVNQLELRRSIQLS